MVNTNRNGLQPNSDGLQPNSSWVPIMDGEKKTRAPEVYKCKEEDVCLGGDPESCEGGVSLRRLCGR